MSDELKIWLAVRLDLDMPPGKLAAQAGHGFAIAVWKGNPDIVGPYMRNSQAKVVVGVADEAELLAVATAALDADIPTHLIRDAGRTVFGEPTYTVAAIGPATMMKLPSKIKRLRLL